MIILSIVHGVLSSGVDVLSGSTGNGSYGFCWVEEWVKIVPVSKWVTAWTVSFEWLFLAG